MFFATKALTAMGYNNVAHLEPGFGGWAKAEEPVTDFSKTSKWVRRET